MALKDRIAADKAKSGGGDRKNLFKDIAAARTTQTRRKDLPVGTGWYLVNDVKFVETPGENGPKYHLDKASLKALVGLQDGAGLMPGEPGYSGPAAGEDYEWTIWRDGKGSRPAEDYLQLVKVFAGFLKETTGCHPPLTQGEIKDLQTEKKFDEMMDLIEACVGFKFDGSWVEGTDDTSSLCGLAIAEITVKQTTKNRKGADGKEVYVKDESGEFVPEKVTYTNVYWNRQVSVGEVFTALGDDEEKIKRILGGEQAFNALATVA